MFLRFLQMPHAQNTRLCSVTKLLPNGDEETRTPDLRRAKAALSQLSYIPFWQ